MNDQLQYSKNSQSEKSITPAQINTSLNLAVVEALQCAQFHRRGLYSAIHDAVGIFTVLYNETYLEVKDHMEKTEFEKVQKFILTPLIKIDWKDKEPESKLMRPQFEALANEIYELYLIYQIGLLNAKIRNITKAKII